MKKKSFILVCFWVQNYVILFEDMYHSLILRGSKIKPNWRHSGNWDYNLCVFPFALSSLIFEILRAHLILRLQHNCLHISKIFENVKNSVYFFLFENSYLLHCDFSHFSLISHIFTRIEIRIGMMLYVCLFVFELFLFSKLFFSVWYDGDCFYRRCLCSFQVRKTKSEEDQNFH